MAFQGDKLGLKSLGMFNRNTHYLASSHYNFSLLRFLHRNPSNMLRNALYLVGPLPATNSRLYIFRFVLAAGWGDKNALATVTWSLASIPPLAGLSEFVSLAWCFTKLSIPLDALCVQGFFSWRIWKLARGNLSVCIPLLGTIGMVSFLSLFLDFPLIL